MLGECGNDYDNSEIELLIKRFESGKIPDSNLFISNELISEFPGVL